VHDCFQSCVFDEVTCMLCTRSSMTVLQTKGQADVNTGGLGGPVVSNGLQHSGTAMSLKVGMCQLEAISNEFSAFVQLHCFSQLPWVLFPGNLSRKSCERHVLPATWPPCSWPTVLEHRRQSIGIDINITAFC